MREAKELTYLYHPYFEAAELIVLTDPVSYKLVARVRMYRLRYVFMSCVRKVSGNPHLGGLVLHGHMQVFIFLFVFS